MQEQLTRMRGAWGGLPRRAQIAIAAVGVITLVLLVLIFRAATNVTYAPVTGEDLTGDKLGQAQTALEKEGFETRMNEAGTAVEVPVDSKEKAMGALMTAGISSRVDCMSGEKKMFSGTSAEFARDQNECLQKTLTAMIEQNEAIKAGSVIVKVQPKDDDFFATEADPAKASISYRTDGARLPAASVRSIQATVAGAVAGLKAEDVTVMDNTQGKVVSGDGADDGSGGKSKLQMEAEYNAMIESKLQDQAEQIVGTDNVRVISNVELDMDTISRTVHQVGGPNGEQGPVSAEVLADEVLSGGGTEAVEGATGTANNITDPADRRTVIDDGVEDEAEGSGYVKKDATVSYDNSFVNEDVEVAVGDIVRNRFAVVVDDDVDPASAAAVSSSLKAYMGGNAEDSFAFSQAPLAIADIEKADAAGASRIAAIMDYLKWALLGLALLALAFVLRRSLTQRTAELLNPADDLLLLEPGFEPIPLAELEAALAAGSATEGTARKELHRKVEEIAEAKPHDVANELRRWMHQDDQVYAAPTRR